MYADRYGSRQVNKGSLALSVSIVGGLLAVAMVSNTVISIAREHKRIEIFTPLPDPPPPPPDPQPKPHQLTKPAPQPIDQTIVPVPPRPDDLYVPPPEPGPLPPLDSGTGAGAGTAVAVDPPKPAPPVLRGADVDARYARDLQPDYPTEERRAGREGVVTLRVLIGVDGRVREVEKVAAASDAFWRVTQQRALARWRFHPATRDGVPFESWKTMTVRFHLEDDE